MANSKKNSDVKFLLVMFGIMLGLFGLQFLANDFRISNINMQGSSVEREEKSNPSFMIFLALAAVFIIVVIIYSVKAYKKRKLERIRKQKLEEAKQELRRRREEREREEREQSQKSGGVINRRDYSRYMDLDDDDDDRPLGRNSPLNRHRNYNMDEDEFEEIENDGINRRFSIRKLSILKDKRKLITSIITVVLAVLILILIGMVFLNNDRLKKKLNKELGSYIITEAEVYTINNKNVFVSYDYDDNEYVSGLDIEYDSVKEGDRMRIAVMTTNPKIIMYAETSLIPLILIGITVSLTLAGIGCIIVFKKRREIAE